MDNLLFNERLEFLQDYYQYSSDDILKIAVDMLFKSVIDEISNRGHIL